jgi:hypothetical protein
LAYKKNSKPVREDRLYEKNGFGKKLDLKIEIRINSFFTKSMGLDELFKIQQQFTQRPYLDMFI